MRLLVYLACRQSQAVSQVVVLLRKPNFLLLSLVTLLLFRLLSRIYGLFPARGAVLACDTGLFP
jgi:hypothetical protein